jgi:hypothetical protein
VVQKLYCTHPTTPTRCARMLAAPSQDWNVFQRIFVEHWDGFKHVYPRDNTPYYDGLVDKMLGCGNPEKIGYREYRCLHCRQGTHRVAMSCKSSLCLRCAKVYVDNWVSQVSRCCTRVSSIAILSWPCPRCYGRRFISSPKTC